MGTRTQARVRRDINRLVELIDGRPQEPALQALRSLVVPHAERVNAGARTLAAARLAQDKEAAERDTAARTVLTWIQTWRPLVLIAAPGAAANLRALPAGAATADDLLRVVSDLRALIDTYRDPAGNPFAFAEAALAGLAEADAALGRESSDAVQALAAEAAAQGEFAEATAAAAPVIVRGSQVVRALFGPTSPEYRRLVQRSTPEERAANDAVADPVPATPAA